MAAGARALAGLSLRLVTAFEGWNGEKWSLENNATIIKFSGDANNVLACCEKMLWGS